MSPHRTWVRKVDGLGFEVMTDCPIRGRRHEAFRFHAVDANGIAEKLHSFAQATAPTVLGAGCANPPVPVIELWGGDNGSA
ncbi:hypothetical protein GRI58_03620 [Porphyrobacter algicida]|uniref:Uncharacterized protein n=1 Tax=Qipengyuania algicida TaxID=1836209 RepID=A0A845ACD2_9SPHN|nr:hypothetical protein [Qipengyuania algicida]MXP27910.1 hypothetical protein [Qipengyuania algicida]